MPKSERFADLEYDKALEQIASRTHSSLGRLRSSTLHPLSDINAIKRDLQLISEVQTALKDGIELNLEPLSDIAPLFGEQQSGIYAFEEFFELTQNLALANRYHKNVEYLPEHSRLAGLFGRLKAYPELEKRFEQIFDPEGDVKDTASSELLRIRRSLSGLRGRIQKTLQGMLQDPHLANYLQDKFVTQRDDRYVLPFKESSSSFVKGIVQSQSGSGSTLYIEPEAIVPLNNDLQILKQEEKKEIFRIFSSFTEDFRSIKSDLLFNQETLSELDFRYACGRFCNSVNANVPAICPEPILELRDARHPLLILRLGSREKVIPFALELGLDYNLLVLSGPNTGGKTVLMKASGLITLLALSGLPVPVAEDSKIGLFSEVFADIGDDQSIESALSTFSSHLDKIERMLSGGTTNSLILIDEIGAATDPQQGAALAQAVLEEFSRQGCKGIVTTHYTALKVYAEQAENCVNASMQFDLTKLSPTYRFEIGFPGDSFAIEVAASRGLAPALIERAKELSGSQNLQFTELLKKLEAEKKALGREHYEYQLKNRNLEARLGELESKEARLEDELKQRRQKHLKELQSELISQQKIYQRELDELKALDRTQRKTHSERKLHTLQTQVQEINEELTQTATGSRAKLKEARPGDRVWLPSFEAEATILEIRGDQARVDMNGISFKTPLSSLYQGGSSPKVEKPQVHSTAYAPATARYELKLLGLTFDEAEPLIDEFLDAGTLAGLHKLRIVHGKGTGALRNKVRSYLMSKKQVIDIETPSPSEGGSGVTVVKI